MTDDADLSMVRSKDSGKMEEMEAFIYFSHRRLLASFLPRHSPQIVVFLFLYLFIGGW
jgi:hypothetical protein